MNPELLAYAVALRVRRARWAEVSRRTGVPKRTLLRWQKRPEWVEERRRCAAELADELLPASHAVLLKRLRADHAQGRPDTTLAEKLVEWLDPRVSRGAGADEDGRGATNIGGVFLYDASKVPGIMLPLPDQGLRSRLPAEVLGAAAPARNAQPTPAPAPKGTLGKPRRRIVVQDEA